MQVWAIQSLALTIAWYVVVGPGWDQEHPPPGFALQFNQRKERGCKDCKGSLIAIIWHVNPLLASAVRCTRVEAPPVCFSFPSPLRLTCRPCFLYLAPVVGPCCLCLAGNRSISPPRLLFKQRKKARLQGLQKVRKKAAKISAGMCTCQAMHS